MVRYGGTVVRYGGTMVQCGDAVQCIITYGWCGSKAQFLVRCFDDRYFCFQTKRKTLFFWILYLARTISVETFEAQTAKYSGILVRQC